MKPAQRSGLRTQRLLVLFGIFLSSEFCFLSCNANASGDADGFALTGIGARAGGMGNAFIGLSDEIETVYYNPAGLGNLMQSGVTAMYQAPAISTSREFVGFDKRFATPRLSGSLGFGWLRLQSTHIELTSTDEQILGSADLTNDLFLGGIGVHPFEHVSLGASMKYFRFAFDGFSESGFGWDMGAHVQYNPLRVGVALTDVGGTVLKGSSITPGGGDVEDKVPMRLRPGAALSLGEPFDWPVHVNLDVDGLFRLQGAQDARLFAGGEVWGFRERFAFRTGLEQGNGPTIGFGARWGFFQLDYSFLLSQNLQDEHRIGTTFRF